MGRFQLIVDHCALRAMIFHSVEIYFNEFLTKNEGKFLRAFLRKNNFSLYI